MAKKAAPSNQVVEDALNAVEDALKIDFLEDEAIEGAIGEIDTAAAELSSSKSPPPAPEPPVTPAAPPANDDRRSSFAMLSTSLAKRPPSTMLWIAFFLSLVWGGLAFWAGQKSIGPRVTDVNSWTNLNTNPDLIFFAAAVVVPILLIWGFSVMVRRSQELSLAARSMTEAAYRLIEPETEAVGAVRSVGTAVRREVEGLTTGIENAINRASELESMVHNEVVSLSSSYSENELKMRGLVEELANEREAIVIHSERVRSSISGASDALKEDLSQSAVEIQDSVSQAQKSFAGTLSISNDEIKASLGLAAENLAALLSDKSDQIGNRIEEVGGSLVKRISQSSEGAGAVIEAKSNELAEKINFLAENMQTSVTGRIDDAVMKLDERNKLLIDNVDKIDGALEGRTRQINDTLVERTREIASAFSAGQSAIKNDLAQQLGQTQEMMDNKALELSMSWAARVEEINQSILAQVDEADSRLAGRLHETKGSISSVIEEVDRKLADRAQALQANLQGQAEAIDATLITASSAVVSKFDEADQRWIERTEAVAKTIEEQSGAVEMAMEMGVGAVTDRLKSVDERLAARTDELAKTIEDKTSEVDAALSRGVSAISGKLDEADERIASRAGSFREAVEEQASAIDMTLQTRADIINSSLDGGAQRINEVLAERARELSAQLDASLEGISSSLTSETQRAEQSVAASIKALEGQIEKSVLTADQTMAARSQQVIKSLSERTAELNTMLAARSRELSTMLVKDTLPALKGFEQRGAGVAELMADKVRSAADDVAERLEAAASGVSEKITQSSGNVAQKLEGAIVSSNERMEAAAQAAAEDLAKRYMALEGQTSELIGQLSASTQNLTTTVENHSGQLVSTGDAMARKMAEVAQEVSERVRAENESMVNAITARSRDTIAALSETNGKLAGEIGDLLGRLDQSNGTLSELIVSADSNLTNAQRLLAERAAEFRQTVGEASDDLNSSSSLIESNYLGLKDVSGRVLVEISDIASRFAEQSDALTNVSRLLDQTQGNMSISLDERRNAIEALTNGLVSRSADLEELMRRFTEMMSETVNTAEGRARSLTSGLSESVASVAKEATERFAQATEEMRMTAQDLRSEISRTRAEMKKSVLELPDETKESTSAMRRVVSDQIKALKDLNDIVSKAPRYQDATPSNVTPPAAIAQPAPVAEKKPEPRPAPEPPRPAASEPVRERETVSSALRGPINFDQEAETITPKPQSANSGWVSDLLRRASRDEDAAAEPSPRARSRSNESLNSLSTEIARSIDHDEAVRLWDRYQRGERGIFKRDIYTPEGRRVFDEISDKFDNDPKFRDSVKRYVTDFERLIADVSKNDRDNVMTQTYLVSDTGKVYTMLAHAAGRFA
ncbi:hypothetical protein ACFQ14_16225 [Pseudahrensia aquimaris]|uniref:Apolipoprotein A1/A4/E domain-containing protein n=1 Tax=Pseudahrensia aquimaris TaxID=744461 RepID=A0ABW3FP83_9HYPH